MSFVVGDLVRLTAFHRTQDNRQVIVSLNVGDRLQVAGSVTGSPDVRCRFPDRPNRWVVLPADKLRRVGVGVGGENQQPHGGQ